MRNVQRCTTHPYSSFTFGTTPQAGSLYGVKQCPWNVIQTLVLSFEFLQRFIVPGVSSCGENAAIGPALKGSQFYLWQLLCMTVFG